MRKGIQQAYYYRLTNTDHSFTVYTNDQLLGSIYRPTAGQWPVNTTINGRLYYFIKVKSFSTVINIVDEANEEIVAIIKMPLLSLLFPYIRLKCLDGEEVTWAVKNFFSLHWQWKKNEDIIVEVIDDLVQKDTGIIVLPGHTDQTDLLIITGFFLSLLRRSRLSMGVMGLKNKRIKFSKKSSF